MKPYPARGEYPLTHMITAPMRIANTVGATNRIMNDFIFSINLVQCLPGQQYHAVKSPTGLIPGLNTPRIRGKNIEVLSFFTL